MIANVSPAQSVYEDTLNTIKYADRAKSIRSDLKKRVIERNLHVGKYKEIITNQKKRIQSLEGKWSTWTIPDRLGVRLWTVTRAPKSLKSYFSEEIQDLKKQRPKKKDDEINPIWETLLKVIFDVTRLKGDIRNARLDKFLKEAQFDRKQSVCGKSSLQLLTLIPCFLGPSPRVFSGKKNPDSSLVTSQLGLRT